jgi:predicted permease
MRHTLRVLIRTPVFTAVAVLSLAIGIGANTVMFSVARFALLDPLPVDRPADLRVVEWVGPANISVSQYNSGGSTDRAAGRATRTNYNHQAARALEQASVPGVELFAFNFVSQLTVRVDGQPAIAAGGMLASGRYYEILKPPMSLGRGLTAEDDEAAAPNAAVIGHALWLRAFGGARDVLGRNVAINGVPFAIVGVTAAQFRGLSSGSTFAPLTDVTVPIAKQPLVWAPENASLIPAANRLWLRMMARVTGGATEREVTNALTSVLRGALAPSDLLAPDALATVELTLAPGSRGIDGLSRNADRPVRLLAAVVGVVLLIACVNLASLSLARGITRQRELAVRRALGASRGRLVLQLLQESFVIAIAGGLAGALLALWFRPIVAAMVASGFGVPSVALPFDWRTFALTAVASIIAGVLFGLLPAVGLTRPDRTRHLRHRTAGDASPKLTIGRVLLAVQIGVSVPLIVTAGLLLQTVNHLSRVDLGFTPANLVMFRVDPNQTRRPTNSAPAAAAAARQASVQFAREVIAKIESLPGVQSATLVENALLSGWVSNNSILVNGEEKTIHMNGVGPRYFETMGMPIRVGRAPTLDDTSTSPQVAVINETAARQIFGQPAPIGRRFTMGRREIEVVGVVADSKYHALRAEVVATMFDPFPQRAIGGAMYVVVRTRGLVAAIDAALTRAVAEVDPGVPVTAMRTQIDHLHVSMGRERLLARLMALFGGFALVLACIGLYGATSYAVARRTNEIGVRVALGAQRWQVLWLVLRQVMILAGVGLSLGIPASLAAGPLVGSMLYGLGPRDPVVVASAAATMLAVAMAAGFLPARRAARLEVLKALRVD